MVLMESSIGGRERLHTEVNQSGKPAPSLVGEAEKSNHSSTIHWGRHQSKFRGEVPKDVWCVCVCTRTVDTEVILNLPDLQEIQRQKLCFVLATGFCTLSLSKKGLVLFFFLIRTYLFLRDIFCIHLTEIFFSNPFW